MTAMIREIVLTKQHKDILTAIKSGNTTGKKIFSRKNTSALAFLVKNNFIEYDTNVYPQKPIVTNRADLYLKTGKVPSEIVLRKGNKH